MIDRPVFIHPYKFQKGLRTIKPNLISIMDRVPLIFKEPLNFQKQIVYHTLKIWLERPGTI